MCFFLLLLVENPFFFVFNPGNRRSFFSFSCFIFSSLVFFRSFSLCPWSQMLTIPWVSRRRPGRGKGVRLGFGFFYSVFVLDLYIDVTLFAHTSFGDRGNLSDAIFFLNKLKKEGGWVGSSLLRARQWWTGEVFQL